MLGLGILYLSMIRDLYDNSIVAYKTSSQQTVNLVLDTIRLAIRKEKTSPGLKLGKGKLFEEGAADIHEPQFCPAGKSAKLP